MKMMLFVMMLTAIAVLASASSDDHLPDSMSTIILFERVTKAQLRYDETLSEKFIPAVIKNLKQQMEELSGEEARLLSQYNDIKRSGLNVFQCGLKHDDNASAANQTLVKQIQERKELLSIGSALSQVDTQILKLMEDELKFHELSMQLKVDIAKHHQEIIQLQSKRLYLQSQSQSYTTAET